MPQRAVGSAENTRSAGWQTSLAGLPGPPSGLHRLTHDTGYLFDTSVLLQYNT